VQAQEIFVLREASSRAWFELFASIVLAFSLSRSQKDHSVF